MAEVETLGAKLPGVSSRVLALRAELVGSARL